MSYSQDFPPADAVYAPASDGLMLDLPPLVLVIGLLLLLLAGYAGWMLAQRRQPTSASAAAAIWKDIDEAIRAAMTAHSDVLRDKARTLIRVIENRLGRTLALANGLEPLTRLEGALRETQHDAGEGHDHDQGHGEGHEHGDGADPHAETHDAPATPEGAGSTSTVLIERVGTVIVQSPPSTRTGTSRPPTVPPAPTEGERRARVRQAVSDLNDHWRHKDARIAEIEAAHRELSAPRR